MVEIYDLLGTLNEPVSRIPSFNGKESESKQFLAKIKVRKVKVNPKMTLLCKS